MRFKVEISLNDKIVREIYFADDLSSLEDQVKAAFPKGKIISIIGG